MFEERFNSTALSHPHDAAHPHSPLSMYPFATFVVTSKWSRSFETRSDRIESYANARNGFENLDALCGLKQTTSF